MQDSLEWLIYNINSIVYILSKITAQAFFISDSLMVSGGEIRRQLEENKNQSVNTPLRMQLSMILLQVSADSNSTANQRPAW